MSYKTEQEEFWSNEFGSEYIDRNKSEKLIACNTNLFASIFAKTGGIGAVLEMGANIGNNIHAIKRLLPSSNISAIEINENAYKVLNQIDGIDAKLGSILEFEPDQKWDFVFTKGVLIHLNPDILESVYQKMYDCSSKYMCIAEYYNPAPVSINYRGHTDRLFKRDFAGEMLDKFSDLKLIAYDFVYHRDKNFPLDDITWFLMEKI